MKDRREDASTLQLGNVAGVDAKLLQPLNELEGISTFLIGLTLGRLSLLRQGFCFCS